MAFVAGELVAFSFTRWAGFVIGGTTVIAPTRWRVLLCSDNPAQVEIADTDDGLTVFHLTPPVATPAGMPAPGTIVKVLQSPLAFIALAPLSSFPFTLPVPYVAQVYFYVDIGGFGIYAVLMGNDGTLFLALPEELTL